MKTTLNIDATVMRQLKEEAVRCGTTVSALVETEIRRILAAPSPPKGETDAPRRLPTWDSGGFRVDVANRGEINRILSEG